MPEALRDRKSVPGFSRGRLVRSPWTGAVLVAITAAFVLGHDLASETYFVDESAYYSQSYYTQIFFSGRFNDPAWLEFPAYDLPPLPKYLIGTALALGGYKTPGPAEARAWYADTSVRFDPPGALTTARVPSVLVGVIGCVAIYGLGVIIGGRSVGLLAAGFLMANPLYFTHARRAMSDVPCEAFILLSLFLALWTWKRHLSSTPISASSVAIWSACVFSGVAAGLAVLSKLTGMLALMVAVAWFVLALLLREPISKKTGLVMTMAMMAASSAVTFIALNPYLTAHPGRALPTLMAEVDQLNIGERTRKMAIHRVEGADGQKVMFKHNAMNSAYDKISTTAVQGFGRFGPFGTRADDSTIRYDFEQDRGGILWLPWVLAGTVWAAMTGLGQYRLGEPPTAWALLLYFLVVLTVVTAYLPLAWNRYFLPIQAPSALLAAGIAVAGLRGLTDRLAGRKVEV